jgi:hypothetical protein
MIKADEAIEMYLLGPRGRRRSDLALSVSLLILLLVATACASGGGHAGKPAPIPYELIAPILDRATLEPIERWGYDAYVHDMVASRATAAVQIEIDLTKTGAMGWIVVPYEQGMLVRFIDHHERSIIDVSVDPFSFLSPFIIKNAPPKDLDERDKSMWRARELALDQPFTLCAENYDVVVIPESDAPDSSWLVYMLATSDDETVITFGGHQKFRIDPEGRHVQESIPLSTACMTGHYTESTTEFRLRLDSGPSEAHVYLNHLHGIPITIEQIGGHGLWTIEKGRVRTRKE